MFLAKESTLLLNICNAWCFTNKYEIYLYIDNVEINDWELLNMLITSNLTHKVMRLLHLEAFNDHRI